MARTSKYVSLFKKYSNTDELRKSLQTKQRIWDIVTGISSSALVLVVPQFDRILYIVSSVALAAFIATSILIKSRCDYYGDLSTKSHVLLCGGTDKRWYKNKSDYVFVPAARIIDKHNRIEADATAQIAKEFSKCDVIVLFKNELTQQLNKNNLISLGVSENDAKELGNLTILEFYLRKARQKKLPLIVLDQDDEGVYDHVIEELKTLHPEDNVERAKSMLHNADYCGIADIAGDSVEFRSQFEALLKSECTTLKIIATTGSALFKNNITLFTNYIASGGSIQLLVGLKDSPFLNEVGDAESNDYFDRNQYLHGELDGVLGECAEIYANAMTISNSNPGGKIGTIEIGGFNTQFRSTIIMCELKDGSHWGWLTVTLPPAKAKGSISLEFDSRMKLLNGEEKSENSFRLAAAAEEHFNKVWGEVAKTNKMLCFSPDTYASIYNISLKNFPQELTYGDNSSE